MFRTKNVCFLILYKKGSYTFFVKIKIKKVMTDFLKNYCILYIFPTINARNFLNFDFKKKSVRTFFIEN